MIDTSDMGQQHFIMDIASSMIFDKEDMLEELVKSALVSLDISLQEFYRDYIIDEFPVEVYTNQEAYAGNTEFRIGYSQTFRIRRKTDEEKQLEIETIKEKNVDQ